jgi:hypothetical protein
VLLRGQAPRSVGAVLLILLSTSWFCGFESDANPAPTVPMASKTGNLLKEKMRDRQNANEIGCRAISRQTTQHNQQSASAVKFLTLDFSIG